MVDRALRLFSNRSEGPLHRLDVVLERLALVGRVLFTIPDPDFRQAAHAAQLRRLAARGCSGQAV